MESSLKEYLPLLCTFPLFRGIPNGELAALLECLRAHVQQIKKGEVIWEPAKQFPFLGVVLKGGIMTLQEDLRGNRSIVGDYGPGDFLGENDLGENALGAADGCQPYFLDVYEKTTALLLDTRKLTAPCPKACVAHYQLMRNMVEALAQKETRLLHKIETLSKRTTRDKVLSYLTILSARAGARKVTIPYTRQELADILAVDRSAMCTELTRMQNDGLIRYDRRQFELL